MASSRHDRLPPILFGATPIKVTPEGFKHYIGTATIGNVVLPYAEPTPHMEFRPAEEVTSDEAIDSMFAKPITDDHPEDLLDPDTVKEHTEGAVVRAWREENGDEPKLKVEIVIYTRPLQEAIEAGKVELSPGYRTAEEHAPGEWKGQPFHVVQRRVRYNHLAVVDRARTRTPTGEVARLDKESSMKNDENAGAPGKMDGLSEEALAMVAQWSAEDQEMLKKYIECYEAEEAEEVAEATGGEMAEDQEEGAAEEAAEAEMEKAEMKELQAMKAELAAIKEALAGMGKKADAAPAIPVNVDAVLKAVRDEQAKHQKDIERHLADLSLVRRDSADVLGDNTSRQGVVEAMIKVIGAETPKAIEIAKRAVANGRMDDIRDLYTAAVEVQRAKRLDAQAEALSIWTPAEASAEVEGLPAGAF